MRKEIYFKLKNFDRPAKEQRAVFYITYFPRGSRLSKISVGGPLTGGRPGAAEKQIKVISLKHLHQPSIGQLFSKFYSLPQPGLLLPKQQWQDSWNSSLCNKVWFKMLLQIFFPVFPPLLNESVMSWQEWPCGWWQRTRQYADSWPNIVQEGLVTQNKSWLWPLCPQRESQEGTKFSSGLRFKSSLSRISVSPLKMGEQGPLGEIWMWIKWKELCVRGKSKLSGP